MAGGMGELLEIKVPRVPFPFFPYSMMMMVTMMVVVMMQVNTTFFRCDGSDSWAHCKLICFVFYCPALPWDFNRSSFLFLLLVRARCPLFLSSLHDLSQ